MENSAYHVLRVKTSKEKTLTDLGPVSNDFTAVERSGHPAAALLTEL